MLSLCKKAFDGKTIFVTGHTGFKGSWLCLWLSRLGAKVTGYALEPPTSPSHFVESRVLDIIDEHIVGDICDRPKLARAIQNCQPDLIFHLAAQSIVRKGYREPWETFSTNVMGTASVLEAIRELERPCSGVLVTSDKCYENREQVWGYREIDAMGEHDPYGGSKGAAELVIRSYRDSFFHPDRVTQHGKRIASARAGNVIGGGDWTDDALIVDMVKALAAGTPVAIRSPRAFRPWQHVLQALSGYLTLGARLLTSDEPDLCSGWNIGPLPGNEIPVAEVATRFIEAWGSGSWIDKGDPLAPREAGILRLAIDKALWNLPWQPGWNVQQTIDRTALWYQEYLRRGPGEMQSYSLSQIAAYEEAMTGVAP